MKLKNWQISSPVLAIQTAVQGGYRLCCFLIRMLVTQVYLLCKNHWVTQFCMCVVFQQKVHYNEKKITKRILRLWHLATLFVKFVGGGDALRAKVESISIYLKCDRFIQDRQNRTTTIQEKQLAWVSWQNITLFRSTAEAWAVLLLWKMLSHQYKAEFYRCKPHEPWSVKAWHYYWRMNR